MASCPGIIHPAAPRPAARTWGAWSLENGVCCRGGLRANGTALFIAAGYGPAAGPAPGRVARAGAGTGALTIVACTVVSAAARGFARRARSRSSVPRGALTEHLCVRGPPGGRCRADPRLACVLRDAVPRSPSAHARCRLLAPAAKPAIQGGGRRAAGRISSLVAAEAACPPQHLAEAPSCCRCRVGAGTLRYRAEVPPDRAGLNSVPRRGVPCRRRTWTFRGPRHPPHEISEADIPELPALCPAVTAVGA